MDPEHVTWFSTGKVDRVALCHIVTHPFPKEESTKVNAAGKRRVRRLDLANGFWTHNEDGGLSGGQERNG